MKKLLAMYICVSALVYGFNARASGLDMPPLDNSHTQFSLVPESVVDNSSSYQIARTYFMPDYQRNLLGRQTRNRVNDGGRDAANRQCETYGKKGSCPSPKVGTGVTHPIPGLTCYANCLCPADYKYRTVSSVASYLDGHSVSFCDTSCGAIAGGNTCTTGNITLYQTCTCPKGYTLQGSCCLKKSCSEYNSAYRDDIPNGYKCTTVSSSQVDGLTCYKDCTLKTCADYGYLASKPAKKACSTATPRSGLTCYYNCKSCSEYSSAYKEEIPADNKCTQVTANTVGGLTCYKDCKLKSCTDYNSSYKTSIPDGYKCDKVTASTVGGLNCYQNCTLKSCTDYNSSYKTTIPADNKCTTVTPRSGLTCYKDCSLKGCTDYGYVASIPSGQSCTSVTPRSGLTCYKDCKSAGYQKVVIPYSGNSIFANDGPNFFDDGVNSVGSIGSCKFYGYCDWDEALNGADPTTGRWHGSMVGRRNSEDGTWEIYFTGGVCYVEATKADGTVEEKTFYLEGICSGISESYLTYFQRAKANAICQDQLNHFNSGNTAGSYEIPYSTDQEVLCNSMK